jgi:hypothetical protein
VKVVDVVRTKDRNRAPKGSKIAPPSQIEIKDRDFVFARKVVVTAVGVAKSDRRVRKSESALMKREIMNCALCSSDLA